MHNPHKKWYKKWWVWVIIIVSILVLTPYIYFSYRMNMPHEKLMKERYRDFPYIATISITNFSNQEEYVKARELIDARTQWVHNQKTDWDKFGRRRNYTLDLSQNDKITVVFGYEEGFDIQAFANEIIETADLSFMDSNNNPIISGNEIISAHCAYHGETQTYDVIIKLKENGMQNFLSAFDGMEEEGPYMQINFEGSIPSDYFTVEANDSETVVIKGLININAAEALVKLIELKDVPKNLSVELNVE